MEAIRVFGVDDHPMCRRGMAEMVATDPSLHWVGEAGDGNEAVHLAPQAAPDVILLDAVMPGSHVLEILQALRVLLPNARVLLTSCRLEADVMRSALNAGATGVLMKTASESEVLAAIHTARRGGRTLSPAVAAALTGGTSGAGPGADLTERERELLGLLALGLANEDIAARLSITVPTVKFHVANILSKMQVANRTAAVLAALRLNIVRLDEASQ